MGAKAGLLVYADGDTAELLRRVPPGAADRERTDALVRRLYPGAAIGPYGEVALGEGAYPPGGTVHAGAWPGLELLCDRGFMVDRPSELPVHLVAAGSGRRLVLHAMHSVVDWLAFAVWEDGRLVRSLSLSPDGGVMEDIGDPLPFEAPYRNGDRPADVVPWPDEEPRPYPLPFHPLEFGEDALRALCGFVLEGMPEPDGVDTDSVRLHGYRLQAPDTAEQEAELRRAAARTGPPRFFRTGPGGSPVEHEGP
ncbi:hypothetical protein SUDANB121_02829 [Nocardiopsis dassonvillei]|uniref:DUF6928 family protein n=1 Tax=Nocardiopsis dassonvillei TaxID=2014 RepID=UPI003F576565